jgi:Transglycosylase SLT domain
MSLRPFATVAVACVCTLPGWPVQSDYFIPSHRLPGIGAGRRALTGEILALRTEAMIQSETFTIMRDPQALAGARRIYGSHLQRIFRDAERKSGFPASTLQAIAYLESWGNPKAESPTGPRGIMQISAATGRRMGLRITYSLRHRVVKVRKVVRRRRGRPIYRTVRYRVAYTVLARDDRLSPERAIPAAAKYLAALEQRYGGRDWAIWAYHCGESCIAEFLSIARETRGLDDPPASVAKVFFDCSPVWNRPLYEAIHAQMGRDYSPTYWFRVMRAKQLLSMYHDDPPEFLDLVGEYKYRTAPAQRAPDRLSVWLNPLDLINEASDAIHAGQQLRLVDAPNDPDFFGFRIAGPGFLSAYDAWHSQASPSALGALAYIAFETRKLCEEAYGGGEPFVPLEVTALALPMESAGLQNGGTQVPRRVEHASGQVFDLSLAGIPADERECLRFVLDDLGWNGYLGFVEEPPGSQTMHIGCSPEARNFFAEVFADEEAAVRDRMAPPVIPVASPVSSEQPGKPLIPASPPPLPPRWTAPPRRAPAPSTSLPQ